MNPTPPTNHNGEVLLKKHIAPGLFSITIRPDNPISYQPGQSIAIGLQNREGRTVRRVYSIVSAIDSRALEFLVTEIKDGGEFSPLLAAINPGSRVWIGKKATGLFSLEEAHDGDFLLLFSTGSGAGACLGLIRQAIGNPRWRRIIYVQGARTPEYLAYGDQFRALVRSVHALSHISVVSRPNESKLNWDGIVGHVQDTLSNGMISRVAGEKIHSDRCHVYACGNPGMCDSIANLLEPIGFRRHSKSDPGNLHMEPYW